MDPVSNTVEHHPQAHRRFHWLASPERVELLGIVASLMAALLIGLLALKQGSWLLALIAVFSPAACYLFITKPKAVTYAVLFLIYANIPVVAVKFHGVPYVFGLIVPLLLLWPIAYRVILCGEPIVWPKALGWIIAYVGVSSISALLCEDPTAAFQGVLATIVEGVVLFLLVTNAVRGKDDLRWSIWALILAGAFMGTFCMVQYVANTYHKNYGGFAQADAGSTFEHKSQSGSKVQRRAAGPIGEKNRFAQVMMLLLPLAAFRILGEHDPRLRWVALFALVLIGFGCATAFSRGAAVALVIALGIAACLGFVRPRHLGICGLLLAVLLCVMPQYRARIITLKNAAGLFTDVGATTAKPDSAIRGRATEMIATLRLFADHPLWGVGLNRHRFYAREYGNDLGIRSLGTDRRAHSLYPQILAESGFVGAICFFSMVAITVVGLFQAYRHWNNVDSELATHAAAMLFMVIAYFASGIFAHIAYIRYLWLMLGLAHACIRISDRQRAALVTETVSTRSGNNPP